MLGPSCTRTTKPKVYLSNCLNHRSLQTANALPQMLNCKKINENNRECLFIFAASMMTDWMTFECHAFVITVLHSMFQVQSYTFSSFAPAPVVLLCRINMDLAFACLQVVDGSKIVHICCRYLRTDECAELGNKLLRSFLPVYSCL
jgi:hypothetical protein